ncbi:MAG: hypothetical protein WCZ23_16430 [Rhodospirillaceae bacterium]
MSTVDANGFKFRELYSGAISNGDEFLKANGIEDDATWAGWKASHHSHEMRAAFLNNLTEEELDKNVMFSVDGKNVIGTYRQHREIFLTEMALFQRAKKLADSAVDINNKEDPTVIEYHKVGSLMSAVSKNMEGALSIAKSYLQSLNDPKDSIKLSPEALLRMGGNFK